MTAASISSMMRNIAANNSDATREATREVVTVNQMIRNAASNSRIGMFAAAYSMSKMRDVDATRRTMKNAASDCTVKKTAAAYSTVRIAATRH